MSRFLWFTVYLFHQTQLGLPACCGVSYSNMFISNSPRKSSNVTLQPCVQIVCELWIKSIDCLTYLILQTHTSRRWKSQIAALTAANITLPISARTSIHFLSIKTLATLHWSQRASGWTDTMLPGRQSTAANLTVMVFLPASTICAFDHSLILDFRSPPLTSKQLCARQSI